MRIDRLRPSRIGALLSALVSALLLSAPVDAQEGLPSADDGGAVPAQEAEPEPLMLIDPESTVGDVGFRFTSGNVLSEDRLRRDLAYRGPGPLAGVRGALDFIPGVSAPQRPDFSPLTLQRDVARLRSIYRRAGFPDVDVDYDIRLDTTELRVHVTFVVDQGRPLVVDSVEAELVTVSAGDTAVAPTASLPRELVPDWQDHLARLRDSRGARFGEQERARLQTRTTDWFHQRGYPWVHVRIAEADTVEHGVRVGLRVTTGPRARIDAITFEGRQRLDERVLEREVPIDTGDWYDSRAIVEGESELYELDLVRRALAEAPDSQARDSTVSLRFRIDESRPRLVSGRVGWRSEEGVAGEAHWAHRDFLGGARTLTTALVAETGWGALESANGRSAGLSATLHQPYVWHRSLAARTGPFVRVRDDVRDRSLLLGLETALIYRARPFETVTLQHEISRFGVDEAFRLAPISEQARTGGRSFERAYVKSVFGLSAAYGQLDDRVDPRSGFVLEPTLEVSGPTGISDVEFFRVAMSGLAALPISRGVGLYVRASGGRLFPFGDSDPGGSMSTAARVGLRDFLFTAGGTADVRGWGSGALGPKIPEIRVGPEGVVNSDRYVPVGGLARVTGSVELALPFPFLPPAHRTFLFFDSGRIWTPGTDFQPEDPALAIEPWGHAVGGGLQIGTPVGPVRVAVGYKLNPSEVDLRSAGDVARSLAAGEDLSTVPADDIRRWHLHLSIGRGL